jgi:hypothetical protein
MQAADHQSLLTFTLQVHTASHTLCLCAPSSAADFLGCAAAAVLRPTSAATTAVALLQFGPSVAAAAAAVLAMISPETGPMALLMPLHCCCCCCCCCPAACYYHGLSNSKVPRVLLPLDMNLRLLLSKLPMLPALLLQVPTTLEAAAALAAAVLPSPAADRQVPPARSAAAAVLPSALLKLRTAQYAAAAAAQAAVAGCPVPCCSPMRPIFMPARARARRALCAPGPGVLVLLPPVARSLMCRAVMPSSCAGQNKATQRARREVGWVGVGEECVRDHSRMPQGNSCNQYSAHGASQES